MTFGEHLEELRQALVKAILWLAGGMIIGLYFAGDVVLFVQTPLEAAIRKFNADRDMFQLGYDPTDPAVRDIYNILSTNALVAEIVLEIPDEYQTLTMDSLAEKSLSPETAQASQSDQPAQDRTTTTVEPIEMAKLLKSLPDPKALKPKLQLRQNNTGLSSLKVEEPFMVYVKAGLIVGGIFTSPMIFYHLWSFVAAGLHAHERKYVYIYLPISVLLFISGVVLAFFVVLHFVLTFLLAFNGSMDVAVQPRLTHYINFVLLLPLGFGIAFQLPLVMLFLQRIGLFETEAYVGSWKIAVLVIFVISMILTPADVTSMVALAIPLIFLYALGILMCYFIPRGRGLGSAAYDPA